MWDVKKHDIAKIPVKRGSFRQELDLKKKRW